MARKTEGPTRARYEAAKAEYDRKYNTEDYKRSKRKPEGESLGSKIAAAARKVKDAAVRTARDLSPTEAAQRKMREANREYMEARKTKIGRGVKRSGG